MRYNYTMKRQYIIFKNKAISLRKNGKTYGEITKILNKPIPKSTLSLWFKNITLSAKQKKRITKSVILKLAISRKKSLATNKKKRGDYLKSVENRIGHLRHTIKNKDVAKIALAMLYLGEGTKKGSSLIFGNSNPVIIKLFTKLLRYCYNINENKFRCTLQCRADQNIKDLEKFWSEITNIPLSQFYKAQIDPRTIGKPSKKLDYKGVCRIDYFSADLFNEIMKIAEIINKGR